MFHIIALAFCPSSAGYVCVFALTPECSTQDLRVEPLLVFADLWCVALRAGVDRVDVHHRTLSGWVGPQRLCQPGIVPVA